MTLSGLGAASHQLRVLPQGTSGLDAFVIGAAVEPAPTEDVTPTDTPTEIVSPTATATEDVTLVPTVTATEDVTLVPTALPFPTLPQPPTPTALVSLTPALPPLAPPLTADMEAAAWDASPGWTLTHDASEDGATPGWLAQNGDSAAVLTWLQPLDLSGSQAPLLRLRSARIRDERLGGGTGRGR